MRGAGGHVREAAFSGVAARKPKVATSPPRRLAASAVFRLGECYRKLNRTHDAVAQFQRITREDPDQETLAKLSRQNLVGLGVKDAGAAESHSGRGGKTIPESVRILEAQVEELKQHTIEELPEIIRNWFGAARSLGPQPPGNTPPKRKRPPRSTRRSRRSFIGSTPRH